MRDFEADILLKAVRELASQLLARFPNHETYDARLSGIVDERIAQYEKESLALVNIDEHVKLPPEAFPPDLWLEPYIAADDADKEEDRLDQRLLPLLRQAQFVKRTAA